mmetsp:Transcript_18321/g.28546  ORF Transcript_18321/g.28546 Transcript_18321/m.28546 type:complete len:106 (+) Transcript_18321:347-664(+)
MGISHSRVQEVGMLGVPGLLCQQLRMPTMSSEQSWKGEVGGLKMPKMNMVVRNLSARGMDPQQLMGTRDQICVESEVVTSEIAEIESTRSVWKPNVHRCCAAGCV